MSLRMVTTVPRPGLVSKLTLSTQATAQCTGIREPSPVWATLVIQSRPGKEWHVTVESGGATSAAHVVEDPDDRGVVDGH
jgi:hypothetical protein